MFRRWLLVLLAALRAVVPLPAQSPRLDGPFVPANEC
jgi:hypothetical protein